MSMHYGISIYLLGKHMNADRVRLDFRPQFDLRQYLIGKRVAHDEARMSRRAAKINKTTFRKKNHVSEIQTNR